MSINKHGTGRTTRMIEEAKRLADQGKAVYVIAATQDDARRLAAAANDDRIKFESPTSPGNFEWDSMSLRGAHWNCVVLVDHYAIESRYASQLEMLTRFDV